MKARFNFSHACAMRTAPRIAVTAPPRATRACVARAACPPARPAVPARAPARGWASALLGVLAGLAAGAALVAAAPVVGRTVAPGTASMASPDGGIAQARGGVASTVSAALAPAIDSGVVSAPDPEAVRP